MHGIYHVLVVSVLVLGSEEAAAPALQVELQCARDQFLLGHPVDLKVIVTNRGEREVGTWRERDTRRIQLFVGRNGKDFDRFIPEFRGTLTVDPVEELPPGKSKVYEYRVLYGLLGESWKSPYDKRLVFDRPGLYTLKAVYDRKQKITSNTVQIKILQPQGVDAEVWRQIRHKQFLYFLQHRTKSHSLADTPLRIVEILQEYPSTGYADCFKEALRQYVHERVKALKWRAVDNWEVQQICKALGLGEEWVMEQIFRLFGITALSPREAAWVRSKYWGPQQGEQLPTLEQLCAEMSRPAQPGLRVAPELAGVKIPRANAGDDPYEFEDIAAKLTRGTWVYLPPGYCLVPTEQAMPLSAVVDKQQFIVETALVKGSDYLLGEPVDVLVCVGGSGTRDPLTWTEQSRDQIVIQIAREGEEFVDFVTEQTDGGLPKREPTVQRLLARYRHDHSTDRYMFRVLYTFVGKDSPQRRSRLAFDRPGLYLVRAVFPIPGPGEKKLVTHPRRIRVHEPHGVDAEVWRQIRQPQFLYFLQHRQKFFGVLDDTPSHIATILQEYPTSGYSDCLREALQEYYHARRSKMTKREALEDMEIQRIQRALGIVELPAGIFPRDRRLDVEVKLSLAEKTPLAEVLKELTRQSGVSLRLSPELEGCYLWPEKGTLPLRKMMEYLEDKQFFEERRQWLSQEDGSYLLRAQPKQQ